MAAGLFVKSRLPLWAALWAVIYRLSPGHTESAGRSPSRPNALLYQCNPMELPAAGASTLGAWGSLEG